ncbi:MAG: sodium:proton antiporter [Kiritimatiellia bacterium]|nr:cation:proton antiporter subunit C [Lentisphaerota bacterium]
MMRQATWFAAALVFAMGVYSLCTQRNLIRLCLALGVMESAVLLALVALAYRPLALAPIIEAAESDYVDPLPHALALTAIVIGAAVTALGLALAVMIHRRRGTLDVSVLRGGVE